MEDFTNCEGVLKVIKKRPYYTAEEVMELLGVSKSHAYKIIRELRKDLIKAGKINQMYPAGKVPKMYFDKQFGIGRSD
jgi:predicted HTH transcriptional regulator